MPLTLVFFLVPGLVMLALAWHRSNQVKRIYATPDPGQHEYVVDSSFSPQMNLSERRTIRGVSTADKKRHADLLRSSVAEVAAEPDLVGNINHVIQYGPVHQLGLLELAADSSDEAARLLVARSLGQLQLLSDPSAYLPRAVTDSLARTIRKLRDDKPEIAEEVRLAVASTPEVNLLADPERFDARDGRSIRSAIADTFLLVRAAARSSLSRALTIGALVLIFGSIYPILTTTIAAAFADTADPASGALERWTTIVALTLTVGVLVISEAARSTRTKLALLPADLLDRIRGLFSDPGLRYSIIEAGTESLRVPMSQVYNESTSSTNEPHHFDLGTTVLWRGSLARYSIERPVGELVPATLDGVVDTSAKRFVDAGLDRVRVSFGSFWLYVAGAYALTLSNRFWSLGLISLALLLDIVDNRVAVISPAADSGDRRHLVLWDHYLDRVGDLSLALGGWLAIGQDDPVQGLPIGLFAIGSLLASYSRAEAERLGVLCADIPAERAIRLMVLLGFLASNNLAAGFIVAGGLAFASAGLRMTKALRI